MIILTAGVKDRESQSVSEKAGMQDRRLLCQSRKDDYRESGGMDRRGWTPNNKRIHRAWYPSGIDMREQKGLRFAASLS